MNCTSSDGLVKRRFATRADAKKEARLRSRAIRRPLREYACPSCGGYHVTSATGTRLPLGRPKG